MRASEQLDQLTTAMVAAQSEFPVIAKTHTAKVRMKSGGEYSYSYADLEDVVSASRPVLVKHGLSVRQFVDWDGSHDLLVTRVSHVSGQWEDAPMRLQECPTPQEQGSAITYAKRYAYCAALGIVADEDDDGNSATRAAQSRRASSAPPESKPTVRRPPPRPQADPDTGEIPDEFPQNAPHARTEAPNGKLATDAQLRYLTKLQKEHDLSTSDLLVLAGTVTGRTIGASGELTAGEASALIDHLKDPTQKGTT